MKKYRKYNHRIKSLIFTFFILILLSNIGNAQKTVRPVQAAKGLEIGEKVKNFTAIDSDGNSYSLKENIKKGPIVVIFIRGQWCPICNRHLSKIQDNLSLIHAKGASVVVVSPEKPQFIKKSIEKTGAEFSILYDEGYKISDAFDVTFKPDDETISKYNSKLDAKLKESHSDDSERLPIPATYIIGTDGKIVWRHFDQDYRKRAKIDDILSNIPQK